MTDLIREVLASDPEVNAKERDALHTLVASGFINRLGTVCCNEILSTVMANSSVMTLPESAQQGIESARTIIHLCSAMEAQAVRYGDPIPEEDGEATSPADYAEATH